MRLKFAYLYLILLGSVSLTAQEKFDYQWMAGYPSPGPDSVSYGACIMDFNDDTLKLIKEPKATLVTIQSTASICDKNGKLILYTNGCQMHNGNFELVEGCENLNPGKTYDIYCLPLEIASYPTQQTELILPVPEKDGQYFYLTQKLDLSYNFNETHYFTEFYECFIIDMSLNNGKGKAIDHFTIEYPDIIKGVNLAACKHANGKDWWITNYSFSTNKFYRLLLTKDGISGPWEQAGGPPKIGNDVPIGQSVFSPDGKKYACIYSASGKAWVMDFDRKTGLFSNLVILDYTIYPKWDFRGIAISPNNRFLYVSAGYYLYQYDLIASNIQQSQVLVDSNDGYAFPGWPYYIVFCFAQLAPDGKIYIGQFSGSVKQWSVINKPNELGKECDFKQHSLTFPVWSVPNVPIQPHFRLGPDTTLSSTLIPEKQLEMKSWYSYSSKTIKCWIQGLSSVNHNYEVMVTDVSGRTLMRSKILGSEYQEEINLDASRLSIGTYFVNLYEKGRPVAFQKVIIF